MIKIDGVEKRNLQEQVGYNSEQIDKIFKLLDGLNVQDNLIKLTASSGTLTPEEMAVVERDVAFIIYNNNVYIKTSTSVTEYIFKQVALSASDQGTYNILQSFRIVITRANGAYVYSSNTVLSLYNKAEMDALLGQKADSSALASGLALKANLAGADFTGAITSPSIIENMSGYSVSIPTETGITNTPVYAGIVKNGNKLTLVYACKITKASGGSNNPYIADFNIPEAIGSKLYTTLVGGFSFLDNKKITIFTDHISGSDVYAWIEKASNQKLRMEISIPAITEDTPYYVRYEATFLLSDNLAS